jgi:DNA-binding CsgD family transcriptional regulator/tetratricopeptide (TPR) repeat protein
VPDEALASSLEQSAARVLETGDSVTAMGAYGRAAELSPQLEDRARRNYLAAAAALSIQLVSEAHEFIGRIPNRTYDPALSAKIAWLRQLIPGSALARGDISITIAIADDLNAAGQADQAISMFTSVGMQHWGAFPEGDIWDTMIERAELYGASRYDARLLWLKAFGKPGIGSRVVRDAIDAIDPADVTDPTQLKLLALAYPLTGALARTDMFMDRALSALRAQGNLPEIATAMLTASNIHGLAGRFRLMLSTSDEAQRLAEEARQPFLVLACNLQSQIARALLGDDVAVDRLAEDFPDAASALGQNPYAAMKLIAQGIGNSGEGRHAEAYEQLRRVLDPRSPTSHWAWGLNIAFLHYVDAAARSGHHEEAMVQVDRLEAMTGFSSSPQHRSHLVVARALLTLDDRSGSDEAFGLALSPDENRLPYWRARAMLAYGERLRRQRRIGEARDQLRQARVEFDRMRVTKWASVARTELLASGESSPRRTPDPGAALTPQEERIANLAGKGLSNRDIAEQLFLSPRTVATHLHAVYRKLGISSRSDLAGVLDA